MQLDLSEGPNYFLEPGYMYFSRGPATVRAVLGSCVAVSLWDRRLRYGGINHFLEPYTREATGATPRYGNVACAGLLRMMETAGCRRRDLVAQILGGARGPGPGDSDVGEENVRVAREMLARKSIRIASEDIGGHMGRKIVFDTHTGQMLVLKVHRLRRQDWRGS